MILREQKGLSQERFAELCGISRASIARYEAGDAINRTNAVKIAASCGVTVDYVLGVEQDTGETDDVAMRIRERLRRDPSYRLLFDAADGAQPEHLRAAAAMLKALEPGEDDDCT
jgi:transcriptional regulator with XRE-family HTH domain